VTVLPFSAANGLPDAFARRLARNTQLILLEESNLARVTDPAAGSGRIEAETRQLADAAWELFRQIEAGGGIVTALRSGTFQARIAATSRTRMKDIARRKHLLTGASDYPLLAEPPVAVLDVPPRATPDMTLVETFPGLDRHRLSDPFERLRDTAVTAAEPVFMANLGTSADYNARSAWLKNLLEVGGIATVGGQGCATVDDLVAAFKSSGAKAACLVSSDRVYATTAIAAVRALKAAEAAPIFFAGRPGEGFQSDKLEAAGVDIWLHAGQDVVAALSEVQVRLVGA
jgi:methylmalonyl-CoA mutase